MLGDRRRLLQALTNLASNACRYTPENGNITLALSQTDSAVRAVVSDAGIGIAPQAQACAEFREPVIALPKKRRAFFSGHRKDGLIQSLGHTIGLDRQGLLKNIFSLGALALLEVESG